jgi:hypothetical protein
MANINNIRLGKDAPDNIRFPSYLENYNYKILFTDWIVSDGCIVDISDDGTTLTIKKFNPKKYCIKANTSSFTPMSKDEWAEFAVPWYLTLSGINNTLLTLNTSINDAGTTTNPGSHRISPSGAPTSYYYVKGFSLQPLDTQYDEELFRQYPWDMGVSGLDEYGGRPYKDWGYGGPTFGFINDGNKVRVISNSSMYYSKQTLIPCIGIYGYFTNIDDDGFVDISYNPITIKVFNEGSVVDLSTKECWDAYVGNTKVYHRDKTIENCWKKHGLATETYTDNSGNTQNYGYIKVANVSGYSFDGGLILPEVIDWEDNIKNICWNFKIANTDFWEKVRNWFNNNYTTESMLTKPLFANSNIGGKIQIKLNSSYDGMANPYLYGARLFQGSTIESAHFISENGCTFSSGNGLFLGSGLKEITFESPKGWLIGATDCSGMLSQCNKLTSYPYNLIKWNANRSNNKNYGISCTLMGYCFEYTPFEEIPSFNQTYREADDNTIIFSPHAPQVFNACNSLTKIGPILDLNVVVPNSTDTYTLFNCPNLVDVRIKNLNHGNWSFDGVTRGEGYIGNLPLLNQESIEYLFNNLVDLTTHDSEKHINNVYKSFASWSSAYWNNKDDDRDVITSFRFMDTRLRFAEGTEATPICYTNQTFEEMIVDVSGLQEGDRLEFGSKIITNEGRYLLEKPTTDNIGFKLYSSNPSNKSWVSIQIVNGYDPTNPLVSSANLYCPANWEDKITEDMITSANNKGWTIYTGGTIFTI